MTEPAPTRLPVDRPFLVRITLTETGEHVEFRASLQTVTAIEEDQAAQGTPVTWHTRTHTRRHGVPGLHVAPPIIGHIGPDGGAA